MEQFQKKIYKIGIGIFISILCIGLIIGSMTFLRPTISEIENRKLATFPKFTMSSFLSGEYFSQISLWYSDTFPFREQAIQLSQRFQSLYGIITEEKVIEHVKPQENGTLAEEIQHQVFKKLHYKDGKVYQEYDWNLNAANAYIQVINRASQQLKETKIYSMLIPTSDLSQNSEYYDDNFDSVVSVPVFQVLKEHQDEYIYFHTDHHWTALGAYYAYEAFCDLKGMKAHSLSDYEKIRVDSFVGSYRSQFPELKEFPDFIDAYVPLSTNVWKDKSGRSYPIVKERSGYSTFMAGDVPYLEIENPKIQDGSSCLILKESYANSLIPFLVDHYERVYVLDFRYTNENVVDFCQQHSIDDLLIVNSLQIIANEKIVEKYESILE